MTPDFHDLAVERDDTLIIGLCHAARTTLMELREWAEAVLKATLFEAELQEGLTGGPIGDSITDTVRRLRSINQTHLPEAVIAYDDMIDEVRRGGYTDVYSAYDQLQQACAGLLRIMRELLDIRKFIGEQGDG